MAIRKSQGWRGLLFAVALPIVLSMFPGLALAAEPAGATVDIPVYEQVVGDTPRTDETFTFSLNAIDGAPMPDGSVGGTKTVQITGEGNTSFGPIGYTELGEYHYTISEAKGSNQRYSYDETVYSANVQVTWKNKVGGEMVATLYLAKEDGIYKQEKALFTNQYTRADGTAASPMSLTDTFKSNSALLQTGDLTNLIPWVVLSAVPASVAIAMMIWKKKRSHKNPR